MTVDTKFDAVHVDVHPAAAIDEAPAARIELEGDELVEFSIKPSLWFIAIVSARVIGVLMVLAFAVTLTAGEGGELLSAYFAAFAMLAAVLRVVIASLQWASHVYVLTNRRVMRLSGVLNVKLSECPLKRIQGIQLHQGGAQRTLRLGTICMAPAGGCDAPIVWEHVARAELIHERVVRAIHKSQFKH